MSDPYRFPPGLVVCTPGALDAVLQDRRALAPYLLRHLRGDWGELGDEDKATNEEALRIGARLFSAYTLPNGVKVWCITEADRSVTTFLLPDEY